jgi:hypothetical protein
MYTPSSTHDTRIVKMYVVQIFAFHGWTTTERQFQGVFSTQEKAFEHIHTIQKIPSFRNHVVTITKITPDQCSDSVQVFEATI